MDMGEVQPSDVDHKKAMNGQGIDDVSNRSWLLIRMRLSDHV
jgi:hypothetical protein